MVNTNEQEDGYDDNYSVNDEEEQMPQPLQRPIRPDTSVSINASAIELKVVKPERYSNVRQIADHLLSHRTVVLNLEATNKETAKRLLDFLSGVAYSIDGQLKRVANNTFVITPCNVDVSGDQMRPSEEQQNPQPRAAQTPVDLTGSDTLF